MECPQTSRGGNPSAIQVTTTCLTFASLDPRKYRAQQHEHSTTTIRHEKIELGHWRPFLQWPREVHVRIEAIARNVEAEPATFPPTVYGQLCRAWSVVCQEIVTNTPNLFVGTFGGKRSEE
jgi:hypothetical protein